MNQTEFAFQIRLECLKAFQSLGYGHVGGAMSVVELLSVLYGGEMRIDPSRPDWAERDRFVMSKGHAGPALYTTLALKNYFPMDWLDTINRNGTNLPSHCDRTKTPGIDMSTGSLGQGMSTAIGIAYGNKLLGRDAYTYLLIGDGECQEGQIWEGALFAPQHKLSHLIAFIDCNKQQLDGYTADICNMGDLRRKFEEFGWCAIDADGHDVRAIAQAIALGKQQEEKPVMIVLDTIKGKGCTFAEGVKYNHHMTFTSEQCQQAIDALLKEGVRQ